MFEKNLPEKSHKLYECFCQDCQIFLLCLLINRSTNQPTNQPKHQTTNQLTNQPINQSINQSINQWNKQSVSQTINQSLLLLRLDFFLVSVSEGETRVGCLRGPLSSIFLHIYSWVIGEESNRCRNIFKPSLTFFCSKRELKQLSCARSRKAQNFIWTNAIYSYIENHVCSTRQGKIKRLSGERSYPRALW